MQSHKETSQITSSLKTRIKINKKFGVVDLDEWILSKLDIKESYNVLDVGCGTGNHLIKLAGFFPRSNYYGIDISENSIKHAMEKAAKKNLKIKFICGDASDTHLLKNKFFDLIISIYALYYMKDTKKILSILKTKLKNGGRIAVMSPYKGNNEEWYSFLSSFMRIPKEIESIAENFMDKEVLPFAKSNFGKLQTFNFENRVTIPSYDDLKDYWVANIYHKKEFDMDFEKHASEFFRKNKNFVITKMALLAIMA